jgi:hypothetical protein
MKVYIDKQGISHEETIEFDENNPRDMEIKEWFDKGLNKSNKIEKSFNKLWEDSEIVSENKIAVSMDKPKEILIWIKNLLNKK